MESLTCRIKEHIQPFERKLALQELQALAKGPLYPLDGDEAQALNFAVANTSDTTNLRNELAFWHSVGDSVEGLTAQLRSEATAGIARNGITLNELPRKVHTLVPSTLPQKRCLRYATHGLHEYRGKFFPQLVRALMNIVQLPEDAIVLDPMCGSGTTLVEARLSGRKGYGLDMNPLSVFLTDVKCQALTLRPKDLIEAYGELRNSFYLSSRPKGIPSYFLSLPDHDQTYLARWFKPSTLKELDRIEAAIRNLPTRPLRNFYLVCLSNILRRVSLQKTADLRVRRDDMQKESCDPVVLFLAEALRSTRTVAAFLAERGRKRTGRHKVLEADAREACKSVCKTGGQSGFGHHVASLCHGTTVHRYRPVEFELSRSVAPKRSP